MNQLTKHNNEDNKHVKEYIHDDGQGQIMIISTDDHVYEVRITIHFLS